MLHLMAVFSAVSRSVTRMSQDEVVPPAAEVVVYIDGAELAVVAVFEAPDGQIDIVLGTEQPDSLGAIAKLLTHAAVMCAMASSQSQEADPPSEASGEAGDVEGSKLEPPPWERFNGIGQ